MKRTVVFLALASLVLGTSGCGSCRNMFAKRNKPVAVPVYSQYAPACNTCAPGGAVSYAYGGTPAMVTMPQMVQQMPMAVPTATPSSNCNCVQ